MRYLLFVNLRGLLQFEKLVCIYIYIYIYFFIHGSVHHYNCSKMNTNKMTLNGLSFISRLVVFYCTCFELQRAHHQEFTFSALYRQSLAYCIIFCCIPPVLLRVLLQRISCASSWFFFTQLNYRSNTDHLQ